MLVHSPEAHSSQGGARREAGVWSSTQGPQGMTGSQGLEPSLSPPPGGGAHEQEAEVGKGAQDAQPGLLRQAAQAVPAAWALWLFYSPLPLGLRPQPGTL